MLCVAFYGDEGSAVHIEVRGNRARRFGATLVRFVGGDAGGRDVAIDRGRWQRGIFATAYELSCTCRRIWGENGNEKRGALHVRII